MRPFIFIGLELNEIAFFSGYRLPGTGTSQAIILEEERVRAKFGPKYTWLVVGFPPDISSLFSRKVRDILRTCFSTIIMATKSHKNLKYIYALTISRRK